jgi:hypothetical protein
MLAGIGAEGCLTAKKGVYWGGCFCWPFSLFVIFCYFFLLLVTFVNYFLLLKVHRLLLFLLLITFINYFLLLKVHRLLLFLLLITFINYFLLLRGARGIVLLYLFIVQGEGVRLDFIFLISFTLERDGGYKLMFFLSSFIWHVEGRGEGGYFFS